MDENFFYVATGRALQRFPRGTYPTEKQRITSLCKNEDGHTDRPGEPFTESIVSKRLKAAAREAAITKRIYPLL